MAKSKLFKDRPYKAGAYDQLIRGSVLQDIYNKLAPYGYNIEFIYSEDLENKESYKEGSRYAILRNKKLVELVKTSPLLSTKKKLKNFTERTVVIAFNVSGMGLTKELELTDRSKPSSMLNLCGRELLVGYTYAEIKGTDQAVEDWVAGRVPPLEEVLPPAVEILEIDPVKVVTVKGREVDLGEKPTKDAVIVAGTKDATMVDFEVNLVFMTPSEKVQKEINFILLNSRCTKSEGKSGFVKYEFYKDQKFYLPYKADISETTGMRVLGGTKDVRMYALSETYTVTNAPLLSEYTRYRSKALIDNSKIDILLKLGVYYRGMQV